MTTVTGIHEALAAIKLAGWDQVQDSNGERALVDDITIDPNTDDLVGAYLVEADAVIQLRDGFRVGAIWTRSC